MLYDFKQTVSDDFYTITVNPICTTKTKKGDK